MKNEITTLSRREVLIRLLRVAGVGAGAAGIGIWLNQHSSRPEITLASAAKRGHTIPPTPSFPRWQSLRVMIPHNWPVKHCRN